MKCHGEGCPKREQCERFTKPEEKVQRWFSMALYDRSTGECSHFWEIMSEEMPTAPWYEKTEYTDHSD